MTVEATHAYLFDGQSHALSTQTRAWLASSRRFLTFAEAAKSKIRKKIRAAQTPDSVAAVALEFETAYLLLRERAFSVEYEPSVAGQTRAPDFAVTFTAHSTFMLEVTRLHGAPPAIADAVCGKLGQLAAGRSNVVLIGSPGPALTQGVLHEVMRDLQQRAERQDSTVLRQSRFRDRAQFFQQYRRLSEVLLCGLPRQDSTLPTGWANPQAQHPLPGKIHTALLRSQTP